MNGTAINLQAFQNWIFATVCAGVFASSAHHGSAYAAVPGLRRIIPPACAVASKTRVDALLAAPRLTLSSVMAGLVPAISIQSAQRCHIHRDARDKPGHDGGKIIVTVILTFVTEYVTSASLAQCGTYPDAIRHTERGRCPRAVSQASPGRLWASDAGNSWPAVRCALDWDRQGWVTPT